MPILTPAAPCDVTDDAVLELNTGGDFDNAISGSGQVVKSGDETLTLSGANSYTGGTTISGGTLVASNVEALGTGDITDNATLELNAGGDFANNIGGTGSVVKSGDKTLTLSGSNTYTGGTTISGGTLVASNVEALGTGDITDNATLELNAGGDFANNIGGTGSVVKSGDETLTLSGLLIPAAPLSATVRWSPATLRRWAAATSPTTPRWK
ncbi:autotransporter-associated beta strand repeat-containing protein [Salmonella enterica]|uniref:autotransporter-associated beta strand repeat-containing protein n=1 Tax=Salmonella enterica TaxID=28901 RepID=UPI00224FC5D7|nr:autotransporter-associated beta strand repeat-containing protein [Salmonella enterica]